MSNSMRIPFAIVGSLGSALALAACPLQDVTLNGRVVAARDGVAIEQANVEVFWEERAAGLMSVARQTDSDGTFSLRVSFDTYSGRTFIGREVCEASLQSVRLVAGKDGFAPAEREIAAQQFGEAQRIELRRAR